MLDNSLNDWIFNADYEYANRMAQELNGLLTMEMPLINATDLLPQNTYYNDPMNQFFDFQPVYQRIEPHRGISDKLALVRFMLSKCTQMQYNVI